jgi:threonine dehydrogenase-like Zn-dependent dehydrogenase
MKAVRATDGAVAVVELDAPPGIGGELVEMKSASICSSDLMYLRYG